MKLLTIELTNREYLALAEAAGGLGQHPRELARSAVVFATFQKPTPFATQVRELHGKGATVPEIARAMNQTNIRVQTELKRLGLKSNRPQPSNRKGSNPVKKTETEPATEYETEAPRHVLIIEETGMAYVAPHIRPETPRCAVLLDAFRRFSHGGFGEITPGRFWCDVSEDGNFEIGSRIEAVPSTKASE